QCVRVTNSEYLYVTSGGTSPCLAHVAATTPAEAAETRPAAAAAPASFNERTAVVEGPVNPTSRARWRDKIAGGCRRQLAVATHYLNSSVFPPTRPVPVIDPRPATTAIAVVEPTTTTPSRRVYSPTTTPRRVYPAGTERVNERPRTAGPLVNRRPCSSKRDGSIWHSIPGDGRERAAVHAARVLSASPRVIEH
ncbi:unnamed protein product, partial [Laminaria digitata]